MKKLLCLLGVASLMLTSCSNDDDNSIPEVRVQKTISYLGDGAPYAENVVYNGNKIVSISDRYRTIKNFTYEGDLITKTVVTNRFGTTVKSTDYIYSEKKLVSALSRENGAVYLDKVTYTYNDDTTVSYEKSVVDTLGGKNVSITSVGKFVFKNGNLIKKENTVTNGERELTTYDYDSKNAPFKNILGLNLLLDSEEYLSINNLVRKIDVLGLNNNVDIKTYSYKYNENNYPTEKVKIFHDGSSPTEITEFVY